MSDAYPIHPAQHFDLNANFASVGIVDREGQPWLVVRGSKENREKIDPRELHKRGKVFPAPLVDATPMNRWDPEDLEKFLARGEPPSFRDVATRLRNVLLDHIEFKSPEHALLVTLWIMGTYVYTLFPAYPRLDVNGEKRSGKSKLVQLISELSFNGQLHVLPTPAVLFRLIGPLRPTLCLDEMEKLDRTEAKPIEAITNAGYKAGSSVTRLEERNGQWVPVSFPVYSPMAFAGIAGLNEVTADRAIILAMEPGHDAAKINREVEPNAPAFREIRAGLYRLMLTRFQNVAQTRASLQTPEWLGGRHLELYRPLLTLAELVRAEGDPTFLQDILRLAERERDDRTALPERGRALFLELEKKLCAAETITLQPKHLVSSLRLALEDKNLSWQAVGRLLGQYGFNRDPNCSRRDGSVYTISRAEFSKRAARYGFETRSFPSATVAHWDCRKLVELLPELALIHA